MKNLGFGDLMDIGPMEEWPIGRLFAVASRLSGPAVWRTIERHGLSPTGFFLLRMLVVEDGLRAGEIAKRLMVTPASVTSVVDTLERNGRVVRERSHRDRRGVLIRITDSGRRLIAEKSGPIGRDLGRLYGFIDPADEPAVRRFLLNLIQQFDSYSPERICSPAGEAKGDDA